MTISEVSILLNYKADESYTPQKISIRAGNKHADLKEVATGDSFKETVGWKRIPLRPSQTAYDLLATLFIFGLTLNNKPCINKVKLLPMIYTSHSLVLVRLLLQGVSRRNPHLVICRGRCFK